MFLIKINFTVLSYRFILNVSRLKIIASFIGDLVWLLKGWRLLFFFKFDSACDIQSLSACHECVKSLFYNNHSKSQI